MGDIGRCSVRGFMVAFRGAVDVPLPRRLGIGVE